MLSEGHDQNKSLIRVKYFFLISHGLPFLMTAFFIIKENSLYISNSLFGNLLYLGLLSPTFATLFIMYNFYSKKEREQYWLSVIDFKRISWQWYIIIIGYPLLIRFLSSVIDSGLTVNSFSFNISPDMTLLYAFFLLFFGPIPEELGWRGVALPELKRRYGFTIAVLFLGFMWAIWHLPLFFVEGTYQYQLGLLSPFFWNFIIAIIFQSVVYGVIYFKTNSILSVILFHYIGNLAGETFVMTFNAEIISTVLRGIAAFIILIYYGRVDRKITLTVKEEG